MTTYKWYDNDEECCDVIDGVSFKAKSLSSAKDIAIHMMMDDIGEQFDYELSIKIINQDSGAITEFNAIVNYLPTIIIND